MAGQRDVIEILEQDHREVEEMFAELESLRGASTEEAQSRRKAVTEQVTIELVRHSVAEEVLVYPKVEHKVSAEEVEHARKEHKEAEETLQRLEKLDADNPAFDDELATLMAEIRHHIEDEEGRCSRTCGGAWTQTSCGSWAPASRPSRRLRRPGRTPMCRTRRCRGSQRVPPHRFSTACATSRPGGAPTTEVAVPFTLRNLKVDLEDLGSNFDGAPDLEFRLASKALELERSGLSYQRIPPGHRFPYGHTHKEQEEVYVVVRGGGRMKLDDEIVEVGEWDVVRVPPGTWRGYEAEGPDGLEITGTVCGAPNLGEESARSGAWEGQRATGGLTS
jgi:mannose-6-phosphate isomerase-like protein (cupin superfamily)